MSTVDVARFVDMLFGDRAGYVALAVGLDPYRDDAGRYRHRRWREIRATWPTGRAALLALTSETRESPDPADLYVCPALRCTDARNGAGGPRGTNAAPPTVLWADCDREPDPGRLAALDPLTVASGRPGHRHVYVPLDRPVPVVVHRALCRALAAWLGADAKWADDSLLRLPGTINHKSAVPPPGVPAGPPVPVTVSRWSDRRWVPEELAELLGAELASAGTTTAMTTTTAAAGVPVVAEPLPDPLPVAVRAALAADPGTDRSRAHARVVAACVDAGLNAGQAITVCRGYPPSVAKYGARLAGEVTRVFDRFTSADRAPRTYRPPTRASLTGMVRSVIAADEHDRAGMLAWLDRRLGEHVAAGRLSQAAASGIVSDTAAAAGVAR